jgi:hypothetical protein
VSSLAMTHTIQPPDRVQCRNAVVPIDYIAYI